MEELTVQEQLQVMMTETRKSTANVILAYGAKQSAENQALLTASIAPLEARLDKLDVISDEDGFNSALERMKALEEFLAGAGSLTEVLDAITQVGADITALASRVTALEDDNATNKANIATAQTNITTLNAKVDTNAQTATTQAQTAESNANTYTDTKISELNTTVTEAINEGGQAVIDLKVRVKANEDAINDVEVDGVTQKGLLTKVSDLESSVASNAQTATTQAQTAEDNAKSYADGKFLDADGVKQVMTNICSDENAMREILGLNLVACDANMHNGFTSQDGSTDHGGLNG